MENSSINKYNAFFIVPGLDYFVPCFIDKTGALCTIKKETVFKIKNRVLVLKLSSGKEVPVEIPNLNIDESDISFIQIFRYLARTFSKNSYVIIKEGKLFSFFGGPNIQPIACNLRTLYWQYRVSEVGVSEFNLFLDNASLEGTIGYTPAIVSSTSLDALNFWVYRLNNYAYQTIRVPKLQERLMSFDQQVPVKQICIDGKYITATCEGFFFNENNEKFPECESDSFRYPDGTEVPVGHQYLKDILASTVINGELHFIIKDLSKVEPVAKLIKANKYNSYVRQPLFNNLYGEKNGSNMLQRIDEGQLKLAVSDKPFNGVISYNSYLLKKTVKEG